MRQYTYKVFNKDNEVLTVVSGVSYVNHFENGSFNMIDSAGAVLAIFSSGKTTILSGMGENYYDVSIREANERFTPGDMVIDFEGNEFKFPERPSMFQSGYNLYVAKGYGGENYMIRHYDAWAKIKEE